MELSKTIGQKILAHKLETFYDQAPASEDLSWSEEGGEDIGDGEVEVDILSSSENGEEDEADVQEN